MTYFTSFSGKHVDLYDEYKRIIRRYNLHADVVNAQVSGAGQDAVVAIVCKDGKTYLYKSNGQLIRR